MTQEISFNDAQSYKPCISFLIVTATEIEITEVLSNLEPLPEQEATLKVYKDNFTYYLGKFGAYGVVLTKSEMGSGTSGGSIITTSTAITKWEPKAVVMIGIAFGIDDKKQQIGDVLVSKIMLPYELKRQGKELTVYRSERPAASLSLVNRFQETKDWEHILPNGNPAKFKTCPLLSGEVLVDDLDYRNALLKEFPTAKGGEMEGNGVYIASNNQNIQWIVVKAICDFADGNKSENKKENQKIAIESSVSLTKKVFSSRFAFEDLGFVLPENCKRSSLRTKVDFTSTQALLSSEEAKALRNLIAQNRLEITLKKLLAFLEQANDQEYRGEVLTQLTEFNDVSKRERIGIISYSEARRAINKIVYSILEIIERLTE